MKKHLKRALALVLICTALISSTLSASAATNRWHTWCSGRSETVQFSTNRTATYRVLTQQKGCMSLYNTFKRRVTTTDYCYGTYRVTIVQIKDARGRRVNKTICRNFLWISGGLNARLTKGTYRMTVRSLGRILSPKEVWGPYIGRCWRYCPRWKIG